MTDQTHIMPSTHTASPSSFSIKHFEYLMDRLTGALLLEHALGDTFTPEHPQFADAQEESVNAWCAVERSAEAFLRCHQGQTAVPALTATVNDLIGLLEAENPNPTPPFLRVHKVRKRRSTLSSETEVNELLEQAIPLFEQIASLQVAHFSTWAA